MKTAERPRVLIAAAHSGSGKTTVTSGILRALARRGVAAQPFKVGPDYIDPGYLSLAAGRPAHNLDTWLTGCGAAKRIFADASACSAVSVVEGVMGLYDGGKGGVSSSANIAKLLGIPVVLVIDAKSMGESAAAVALGFRAYDPEVDIAGVILNRLGSENHKSIICGAMERIGMRVIGAVLRDDSAAVSERHLGLLPAEENARNEKVISLMADKAEKEIDLDALLGIAASAAPLSFEERAVRPAAPSVKIGVARDEAFSFYYPESLAELERAGAELIFFSPLCGSGLPDVSGLIFGGGFPEMFADGLAANAAMKEAVRRAAESGMPVYAECGGYMYLTGGITGFDGRSHEMAGVIPAECAMGGRLRTVGYVEAEALCDNVLCCAGTVLRGHEFHFSTAELREGAGVPAFRFRKASSGEEYEAGWCCGDVLGSYLHIHFAGNPALAEEFVRRCASYAAARRC